MLEGTVRSHLSSRQQIGPASARGRRMCVCVYVRASHACACMLSYVMVVLKKEGRDRGGFVLSCCMGPEVRMAWENQIFLLCQDKKGTCLSS